MLISLETNSAIEIADPTSSHLRLKQKGRGNHERLGIRCNHGIQSHPEYHHVSSSHLACPSTSFLATVQFTFSFFCPVWTWENSGATLYFFFCSADWYVSRFPSVAMNWNLSNSSSIALPTYPPSFDYVRTLVDYWWFIPPSWWIDMIFGLTRFLV